MSRVVTPENPLRANAIRAASRIASRVRSDLRWLRVGADVSAAMSDCFRGGVLGRRVEASGPSPQLLETRRLRSRKTWWVQIDLVVPDPNILRECTFGSCKPLDKVAGVVDPVAGEDVRHGVI